MVNLFSESIPPNPMWWHRVCYFSVKCQFYLEKLLNYNYSGNLIKYQDSKALFVGTMPNEDYRWGGNGIERFIRELGKKCGVQAHPHKFRRTLATQAIDKGMPIEQVQRLLGHTKIDTTLHYAMVNQNNVRISHRKYIC